MNAKGLVDVASFTDASIVYSVDTENKTCTCPAYKKSSKPCKHLYSLLGLSGIATEEICSIPTKAKKTILINYKSKLELPVCDFDDFAIEYLRRAMHAYEFTPIEMKPVNPSAKWRIVSALQKSIRRGYQDHADYYAQALLSFDKSYFLYRMAVVSMEDVGAGDPALVLAFLYAARFKGVREQYGEAKLGSFFARKMAASVKDRNACDLLVCADWHPDYKDQRHDYYHATSAKLMQYVMDAADPIEETIALWYLRGTTEFKSPVLPERSGDVKSFIEVCAAKGNPPISAEISRWGSSKQREGHPITIGLTCRYASVALGKYTEDALLELPMLGNYISAAIDVHTREGKIALSNLAKQLVGFDEIKDKMEALGTVLFRLEGHQVNKRLSYPMSEWIQKKTEESFMFSACGNMRKGYHLKEWLETKLDVLTDKRGYALFSQNVASAKK